MYSLPTDSLFLQTQNQANINKKTNLQNLIRGAMVVLNGDYEHDETAKDGSEEGIEGKFLPPCDTFSKKPTVVV